MLVFFRTGKSDFRFLELYGSNLKKATAELNLNLYAALGRIYLKAEHYIIDKKREVKDIKMVRGLLIADDRADTLICKKSLVIFL